MPIWKSILLLSLLLTVSCGENNTAASHREPGILIENAVVIDGSGKPGVVQSVLIIGDMIREVGDIETISGDTLVDAEGLILSPGFIDTHSHHDYGLFENPDAMAAVSQGITTLVVGQDGGSLYMAPALQKSLEQIKVAVNVATYTGHGSLRAAVMGGDYKRPATPDEVAQMKALFEIDLKAGSLGLSTGLEYDPGIYSETSEVIELAKLAAKYGGRYISHMRSEDRVLDAAVDELLMIGREAKLPVQISHIKLASIDLWGQTDRIISKLDKAREEGIDVTADIYPYNYWKSTLTVLLPERDFNDLEAARYALEKLAPADGLTLTEYLRDPSLVGKTVAEIALERGRSDAETYLQLIRDAYEGADPDESREGVLGVSMSEEDIMSLIAWPHTNICSDGAIKGHPRGFGAFPRAIRKYTQDKAVVSIEEMIRKMTSLSAAHMGLMDRGLIREGFKADLVLFDLNTIRDKATVKDSDALSEGILKVWVNGENVWDDLKPTGAYSGAFIQRPAS